jgi:hypothetical protein
MKEDIATLALRMATQAIKLLQDLELKHGVDGNRG